MSDHSDLYFPKPLETIAKIRFEEKKWKTRYICIAKPSPVADCAQLSVFKNAKASKKLHLRKRLLDLRGFYGTESGFQLDKESHTLAVLCEIGVIVLSFETHNTLLEWELWMRKAFGYGIQFKVRVFNSPEESVLFALHDKNVRLHVQDGRFCISAECPPRIVGQWRIQHLRHYGPLQNKFGFEAGTRSGPSLSGMFLFLSSQCDQIQFMFTLAAQNRLHEYLCNESRPPPLPPPQPPQTNRFQPAKEQKQPLSMERTAIDFGFTQTERRPLLESVTSNTSQPTEFQPDSYANEVFEPEPQAPDSDSEPQPFLFPGHVAEGLPPYLLSRTERVDIKERKESQESKEGTEQRCEKCQRPALWPVYVPRCPCSTNQDPPCTPAARILFPESQPAPRIGVRPRKPRAPTPSSPSSPELKETGTESERQETSPPSMIPVVPARGRNYINQSFIDSLRNYHNVEAVLVSFPRSARSSVYTEMNPPPEIYMSWNPPTPKTPRDHVPTDNSSPPPDPTNAARPASSAGIADSAGRSEIAELVRAHVPPWMPCPGPRGARTKSVEYSTNEGSLGSIGPRIDGHSTLPRGDLSRGHATLPRACISESSEYKENGSGHATILKRSTSTAKKLITTLINRKSSVGVESNRHESGEKTKRTERTMTTTINRAASEPPTTAASHLRSPSSPSPPPLSNSGIDLDYPVFSKLSSCSLPRSVGFELGLKPLVSPSVERSPHPHPAYPSRSGSGAESPDLDGILDNASISSIGDDSDTVFEHPNRSATIDNRSATRRRSDLGLGPTPNASTLKAKSPNALDQTPTLWNRRLSERSQRRLREDLNRPLTGSYAMYDDEEKQEKPKKPEEKQEEKLKRNVATTNLWTPKNPQKIDRSMDRSIDRFIDRRLILVPDPPPPATLAPPLPFATLQSKTATPDIRMFRFPDQSRGDHVNYCDLSVGGGSEPVAATPRSAFPLQTPGGLAAKTDYAKIDELATVAAKEARKHRISDVRSRSSSVQTLTAEKPETRIPKRFFPRRKLSRRISTSSLADMS